MLAVLNVVGTTANNVNNLMAGVLGNVLLIQNELGGNHHAALPMLDAIEMAAREAGNEVRQMVQVTTQDRLAEMQPVDLNAIALRVLVAEERQLAPRLFISRYLEPDLWNIRGNFAQLTQLLLGLILNAVEAVTDQGRVIIRTRNSKLTEGFVPSGSGLSPGPHVHLCVEDNGPGDAAPSKTQEQRLKSAREIARRHGGHLWVTGEKGVGTATQAYFPAATAKGEKAGPPATELPRGNETVLVVEDDATLQDVTRRTLGHLGYQTLTAANGEEAVAVATAYEGHIHLALLDMAMPVMGGAEAFPLLKRARPDMDVIICTGLDMGPQTAALIEAGAAGVLLKPFRVSTLAHEIRNVLDR